MLEPPDRAALEALTDAEIDDFPEFSRVERHRDPDSIRDVRTETARALAEIPDLETLPSGATVAVTAPPIATAAPPGGPNTGTTNGSAMATHTTNITAHTSGRLGSRGPFVPSAPLTGSPSESIHIAGTASVGDATDVNAIAAATAIPT